MGEPPFNLLAAGRSVDGLLNQALQAFKDVDQAITNVNRTVLASDTLTKFGAAMSNFEAVTASATGSATEVRAILDSDAPPLHAAITNFVNFSGRLNTVTAQLGDVISNNSGDLSIAVKNFRDVSASLKQLSDGLEAGQGVAGALLKDEQMKGELGALLTNANALTEQFSLFGLHLNQRGIFRMMLKPKAEETNASAHK
jgi:hypothetical protein